MTFPQTLPETQIVAGREFWRLFTPLESSGDIFESDASGLAFVVGPSSDISCINLTHFDETQPNRSSIIEISTRKPLVGRLDAFASKQYGTGQRGRILISSAEYIPQPFFVPQAEVPGDTVIIDTISIDLIQYLTREPATIPPRNDRIHLFQAPQILNVGADTTFYVLPYYGRRYASIMFQNSNVSNQTINVYGVILSTGTAVASALINGNPEILLRGSTVVSLDIVNFEITAEADGMWDLLVVSLTAASPTGLPNDFLTLKVRTSDRAGG